MIGLIDSEMFKPVLFSLVIALAITGFECNKQQSSSIESRSKQYATSDNVTINQHNSAEKCVPLMPNLSLTSNSNSESKPSIGFCINDIDMPLGIQQQGGANPLHSAMKLISVFEKQIYGDYDEEDDEDSEENSDDPNARSSKRNVMQFRQNKLRLAGLNLTMLNIHLYNQSEPKFGLGINIKNTTFHGRFHYNGPTVLGGQLSSNGRSKLDGIYRISIDNVLVIVNSNLTKKLDRENKFKLATNGFQLNISNLGYISIDIFDPQDPKKQTSSYVLRMLQRVLQKTIKRIYYSFEKNLIETLEVEGRRFLDCELTRFEPILALSTQSLQNKINFKASELNTATSYNMSTSLEDLSRIVSSEVANLNLSKISLPDFDYQRQILGTSAFIYFSNGSLAGLNNFRLNGDTRIKLQGQHLLINASLGWFNMRPHYNWTLYFASSLPQKALLDRADNNTGSTIESNDKAFGEPSSKGFVAFNIKAIDFDAVISKGLVSSSRIIVDELTIRRLDGPKMEFSGLPGMNRLARGLVNFFMGRLKQRLVSSIQPALKRELEQVLNRLPVLN